MSQRIKTLKPSRMVPRVGARPGALYRPLGPDVSSAVMKLWPESTVVILATGPSLTQADVDRCCGRARVIAVNDAYKLAPWADALYACDSRWWHWHKGVPHFHGQKYSLDVRAKQKWPQISVLQNMGEAGLELRSNGLRTGKNSGYQAINLAVHLGARTILLLGYDMRAGRQGQSHFFGEHPLRTPPPFKDLIPKFASLVQPLLALGIRVVNCTRESALSAFDRMDLETALAKWGQPQRTT